MKRLAVFYNDKQTVQDNASFSPSAGKPKQVLNSWRELGLSIAIKGFKKLTRRELTAAHSKEYVNGVLNCTVQNGFSNTLKSVADSLGWTTGSMYAAAEYAVRTGKPAASLTSGFHHSNYDSGGGFCTFNGLMITAQLLKQRGLVKKVGILDLDMHYGNGTQNIIDKLDLEYVTHYTFGGCMISKDTAELWLKSLPKLLEQFKDCDVLLFQAGADPHIDDPLGGVLTSEQMKRRDRIVFKVAKKLGIPVAWNLAGGYQSPLRKVLNIHDTTAIECLKAHQERKAS